MTNPTTIAAPPDQPFVDIVRAEDSGMGYSSSRCSAVDNVSPAETARPWRAAWWA